MRPDVPLPGLAPGAQENTAQSLPGGRWGDSESGNIRCKEDGFIPERHRQRGWAAGARLTPRQGEGTWEGAAGLWQVQKDPEGEEGEKGGALCHSMPVLILMPTPFHLISHHANPSAPICLGSPEHPRVPCAILLAPMPVPREAAGGLARE